MLQAQLERAELGFREASLLQGSADRHRQRWILETVLSDSWQSYCNFVRQVCVQSCIGCTTPSGMIAATAAPCTWARVSYVAIQAAHGGTVTAGKTNALLRKEPTWGDPTKIVAIINILNPSNRAILLSHFSGGLFGPKHCQTVRNAAAHKNTQTKNEVLALAASYTAHKIMYPTDAMFWIDPVSGDFAFISWLEDMRAIAAGVTA